nr:hypothetical protein [Gilliamella sp. W8145]
MKKKSKTRFSSLFSTAFLLLIAALASPKLPPVAAVARPAANCDSALMVSLFNWVP